MIEMEYHDALSKEFHQKTVICELGYSRQDGIFQEIDRAISSDEEIKHEALYWCRHRAGVGSVYFRGFYLFRYKDKIVTAFPIKNSDYEEEEFDTKLDGLLKNGLDLHTAFEFLNL